MTPKLLFAACAAPFFGLASHPASAFEPPSIDEPLRCLQAIDGLHETYRTVLQAYCLTTASNTCEAPIRDDPSACLRGLIVRFEDFFAQSRPLLPVQIDGSGFRAVSYGRTLGRIDSAFGALKSCQGLTEWDETLCHYLDLSGAVTDIFYAARLAQVDLSHVIP